MGLGSALGGIANTAKSVVKNALGSSSSFSSIAGPLIGAGASLAGGLYSANKASQVANNINLLNYKQAKEFAQNQIQWRVNDAKKAGIHPLAALGASLYQSSPTAVGADTSGLGQGLSEMGQNISRAIDSYQTRADRLREQQKIDRLNDLRMSLELQKYKADLVESQSRIALNNAKAKAEEVWMKNFVNRASVYGQPRIPARVGLGYRGDSSGSGLLTIVKDSAGNKMYLPRREVVELGQNLYGLPDIYAYGREAYLASKRAAQRQSARYNKSGHSYLSDFTKALSYF